MYNIFFKKSFEILRFVSNDSETDTAETSALVDKAPRVKCPLKISVSMPVISKICFSHLETAEEGIVL